MPKVAICTPTLGSPTWTYCDSMVKAQAHTFVNSPGISVSVRRPPRTLAIHAARQWLAEWVMGEGHDYLWFIDQDAAWAPGTLERLLSRGVPVVAGLTMVRTNESPHPMMYRDRQFKSDEPLLDAYSACAPEMFQWIGDHYDCETNEPQLLPEPPRDSLFSVEFTGCHCMLIDRRVFETVPKPWFYGSPGTEDKWFCLRCQEYGVGVYVDLSVLVGHTAKEKTVGALDFVAHSFFRSNLEAFKKAEEADSENSSQRRWGKQGDTDTRPLRRLGARSTGRKRGQPARHRAGCAESRTATGGPF